MLSTPHRASHMARSSWTIQNKLHVFAFAFVLVFFGFLVFLFLFILQLERMRKHEARWERRGKDLGGTGVEKEHD